MHKRLARGGRLRVAAQLFLALLLPALPGTAAGRKTVSLDGAWQIDESVSSDVQPTEFKHTVEVPGLANLARPAFPGVDQFISREHMAKLISEQKAPAEWMTNYWNGKVDQDRNYFWYRKTFQAPGPRAVAMLRINKAQFGTAVWLNGQKVGEYSGCFSAGVFDITKALHWNARNTVVARIGAHPAVLPDTFPTGSDFEKIKWTPGIYDDVSLFFCDNPVIESVQVAPRLAGSDNVVRTRIRTRVNSTGTGSIPAAGEIIVQTRIRNRSEVPCSAALAYRVVTWKGRAPVAVDGPESISLAPGEEKLVTHTIKIPEPHLWSPEDPFLYEIETSTGGDTTRTRFGMREFRFDAATKRAYLNRKVYYLRGSNITLHRFFEDPQCGALPWNEHWVRRLLGELPKNMHWNYFRFCIGPVPERWLDICDETGLLIQNEFPVWTGGKGWYSEQHYSRAYDAAEMIRQYKDWMRDNWNHPSLAVWDANNETRDDSFGAQIIPAVRGLDLSNRPWENSYNPPAGIDDMVEYHPYFEHSGYRGKLAFKLSDMETMDGKPPRGSLPSEAHPPVINEYGWLWLNRDGTPTELTSNVYAQLMGGTNATTRARLALWSYMLAGETEFWRTHRQFAGIVHFVYLTCSYPGVYTSDHFADVKRLKLDPDFVDYMGEAFKPLGVYINFFQPTLKAGTSREFLVKLVNDFDRPVDGQLELRLETAKGKLLASTAQALALPPGGAGDLKLSLSLPAQAQSGLVLKAIARPAPKTALAPTCSRRWLSLVP